MSKDIPNLTEQRIRPADFKAEQSPTASPRFILAQAGDEAVAVKVCDVERLTLTTYSADRKDRFAVDARMTKGETVRLAICESREEAIAKLQAVAKILDPGAVTL